ncbi:hypothetical protein [Rubrivirga sp. IMCC45206]|uniref:hypothetical protein n=1 Tax=Rubrivirga sp. IMCC45206 TaxID=3391614 RepID=UPI00398FFA8F
MPRLLALALALGLAAPLAAQPMMPDAAPAAGAVSASAERVEVGVTVRARTPMPLSEPGCVGYVDPSAPDVVVDWGGGDFVVAVTGDFDATLAVRRPDGAWACDDDTHGVLPVVGLSSAPAGRYAVWVGAFSEDGNGLSATVAAGPPAPPPTLGPASAALAGRIAAAGGFEAAQGAIEVTVTAGGPDAAERLATADGTACTGYITAARPSAVVDYDAADGTGEIAIRATAFDDEAFADLVLVVRRPDGSLACNDDFGGTDPTVIEEDPTSGAYGVWVGTFSLSDPVSAMLTVTETAPAFDVDDFDDYDGGDFSPEPYSEGSYLALRLDAAPAVRLAADDASGSDATVLLQPEAGNPVTGPACSGYIETAATAGVTLSGEGPFAFRASAEDDLTLTVKTPSGDWWCSDDADGLDPGIQVDVAEPGTYLVWVGTFGDLDGATEATVSVAPGVVESSGGYDGYDGPTQSEGLHDGSVLAPGPGQIALALGTEAEVLAGGPILNPVTGELCRGFVAETPTATLAVDGAVGIGAYAEDTDLTIVVRAPDGSWTCGDDAEGTDPYVTVDGGPGTVTIWVGTFSRRTSPVEATVYTDRFE